jgi:hypothetical protein
MANMIRLPLKDADRPGKGYTVVSVEDVYQVVISGGDTILLYYTTPQAAGMYLLVTITYSGGSVVAADITALQTLIAKVNQQPGSQPLFQLLSEDEVTSVAASSANPI